MQLLILTVGFIFLCVQCLADIEEHLGETISTVEPDLKVPTNEFDGKVTYGQKRSNKGTLRLKNISC